MSKAQFILPRYGRSIAVVDDASWDGPTDIRKVHSSADFVGDNRLIFNIGGNNSRLIAHVAYKFLRVLIKFVGTHAEYGTLSNIFRCNLIVIFCGCLQQ